MGIARSKRARANFAARLFGYDLFISFALGPPPRGTQNLASDLARRLRERDHTVFFSEDEAPPGSPLDATLRRALHNSRVLVVLVNPETLRTPRWVRIEVEEFRRRNPSRPVIPVNIAGALQDAVLADEAQDWLPFRDHIWIDADGAAAEAGLADDALVERLITAPRRVRANVAWRRLVGGSMALLALLTIAFGITAWVAVGQRNEAVALQVIAQGAGVPNGDLDTKLLAAAEALRRYPARMDARLHALEQSARAADQRALLRPGFDPGGWAVTDDGGLLIVAGAAGEVAMLSLDDWHTLHQTVTPMREGRNHPALTISRDGSMLVTNRDGDWTMRRIANGQLQVETVLKRPSELNSTTAQHLSPDHRQLLAAGPLGIWLWTVGEPTATRLADGLHNCLTFSADGSHVLIGDGRSILQISLIDGVPSTRTHTPVGPFHAANTGCTRVLVTEEQGPGSYGASVRDALSGALVSALADAADKQLPAATFSRDGRFVAIANSRLVGWWSVETGKPLWTSPIATPVLGKPFVSPQGEWLALEIGDPPLTPRRLLVYDARTGRIVLDVAAEHPVDDVVFGLHGDSMLTLGPGSGERRGKVLPVWALGHGDRLSDDHRVVAADSIEFGGAVEGLVVALKGGGGLEIRDPISGARRGPIKDDRDLLKAAAAGRLGPGGYGTLVLAPDGHTLGIGDHKGEVALVDLRDRLGSPGRLLHRHQSRAASLTFDPGSSWVASAGSGPEGDVIVQRTDGKSPPIVVMTKVGKVTRLQFIGSERWLRVNDTVWDIERRAPVVDLGGQNTRLTRIEVDPVRDAAAWLFEDGSVRLGRWNAPGIVADSCRLVVRNLSCDEWRRMYGADPYRRTCEALPGAQCAAIHR